jgi:hypothetical protein
MPSDSPLADSPLATKLLGAAPDATAPDGAAVRLLLTLTGGSMAYFELPAGAVSHAVTHRTVEEIWYVVSGQGMLWRRHGGAERSRRSSRQPPSRSRLGRRSSIAPKPARRSPFSRSRCRHGPAWTRRCRPQVPGRPPSPRAGQRAPEALRPRGPAGSQKPVGAPV